ncbi:uncharacterized protein LOC130796654 [Actinidia eriantha]|uniref:uncharacterized protein LOC130796654 n=1 Tax=Actinidia eriantha TaxID=165200 RepID=UPI00258D253F|nr:uncharacterized protein LOC130796654 [Actinidia eriantha]
MATPGPPYFPNQQQTQDSVPNPDSSWHSSGSIGPFFAVISVLAVLAILSCVLGRIFTAWAATPSETIKQRGFFGCLKGRWRWRTGGDAGIGVQRPPPKKTKKKSTVTLKFNVPSKTKTNPTNLSLANYNKPAPPTFPTKTAPPQITPLPSHPHTPTHRYHLLLFLSLYTISIVLEVNQLDQLRDIFSRFDMDSDGSLTLLELATLLRSLGIKPSGDQIHSLLTNMDANKNGFVEFDELVAAISPTIFTDDAVLVNQQHLLEVFRFLKHDGNSYIILAELAGSMAKIGQPLTYRELIEMIKEADTDCDGVISFHEFATIMAKSAADNLGFPLS